MGQAGATARNHIDVARKVELAHFYFFHPAVVDFPGDAHAGDDGHAHTHLDETLDAFDGGHLYGHVQGGFVTAKKLDDAAAEGRFDAVGDKTLVSEVGDIHFFAACERMFRVDDERQLVFQDFRGLKLRLAGDEGDSAEVEAIVEHFVRNVARKHAVDADLHARVGGAELGESGQQGVNGAFIDAEGKFAAGQAFEFGEAFLDFVAEIDKAFGIVAEEGASVRKADGARAAYKEGLAEAVFELADGEADGGLGAIEAFGSAGEAAFAGDGEEDLEFAEIHGVSEERGDSSSLRSSE